MSLVARVILAFHPFVYLLLFAFRTPASWLHWAASIVFLVVAIRLFWLSQQFQRPILFDDHQAQEQKTDIQVVDEKVETLRKR